MRELCRRGSGGFCNVVGVPEKLDRIQRDLLVDNIAGLRREIFENPDCEFPDCEFKDSIGIFKFNRENILNNCT